MAAVEKVRAAAKAELEIMNTLPAALLRRAFSCARNCARENLSVTNSTQLQPR